MGCILGSRVAGGFSRGNNTIRDFCPQASVAVVLILAHRCTSTSYEIQCPNDQASSVEPACRLQSKIRGGHCLILKAPTHLSHSVSHWTTGPEYNIIITQWCYI